MGIWEGEREGGRDRKELEREIEGGKERQEEREKEIYRKERRMGIQEVEIGEGIERERKGEKERRLEFHLHFQIVLLSGISLVFRNNKRERQKEKDREMEGGRERH